MGGWAMADQPIPIFDSQVQIEEISGEVPRLSPDELVSATSVKSLDPQLTQLLAMAPHKTTGRGPWHSGDLELLGDSEMIRFLEPVDLAEISFPAIQYDVVNDTYTPFVIHYERINGLREVRVLVDLRKDAVVAITPLDADVITISDETDFPPSENGGLG
jgi:hypothetical protein